MERQPTQVKIGVVGEAHVGKTSLIARYVENQYDDAQASSIGMAFSNKTITVGTDQVTVSIADTAGQETYRSLAPVYLRQVDIIFLCFDPKVPNFEEGLSGWFKIVNDVSTAVKYLVLTKRDQWQKNADYTSVVDAQALCKKYQAEALFVTSAKNGDHVDDAFDKAVEQFLCKGKATVQRLDRGPEPRTDKDNCC